jgi:hypothetical protein
MLKILFIFLNARVVKFSIIASAAGMLCGCYAHFLERNYMFALKIENKLTTSIAYCYNTSDTDCPHVIDSKNTGNQYYMEQGKKPSGEEMTDRFKDQKIIICGKSIDFENIQSISPIIKSDNSHFLIIIDERVSDAFCHQD